ncbi:TetR/AcrR family transcriptional regulator [Acidisphaera sp. L21]|uniref:TetR/AcrR family transcriptional regulator n=1 Tax=Acidisphaera sp. L21 TaxID=1641851 RepID=UPI00131ACCCB|nr:TetR/AcrR family transcriptional regulator [Acidisphaera sp. L21]
MTPSPALLAQLGEVFREYGFEGASLSQITRATGLGKGSLYHQFPDGKDEMAACVLDEIGAWFEAQIYAPLRIAPDPAAAIALMMRNVETYFRSGRRVCLVGVFATGAVRDRFADRIAAYFTAWRDALATALGRLGRPDPAGLAEDAVAAIQGGLVAARAWDDPAVFARVLHRAQARLLGT